MKLVPLFVFASILAVSVAPADAKGNGNHKKAMEEAKRKDAEKAKKREDRKKSREEVKEYMEPLDTNKDGSLSKDEFMAGEDDKEAGGRKFDQYNKNKDRSLSKKEIGEMLGL